MLKQFSVTCIFLMFVYSSHSQRNEISEKGILIFSDDRMIFFKTTLTTCEDFLKSKPDTGLQLYTGLNSYELFQKAQKIRVRNEDSSIRGRYFNDSLIISCVPANLKYIKKSGYKYQLMNLIFSIGGNKYPLLFKGNQEGFELGDLYSDAMHIRPSKPSRKKNTGYAL
jgi:hypothetical protein